MYQLKDFNQLIGLRGFSNDLLSNHFIFYQGYVNNTNKLAEKLFDLLKSDNTAAPEYAELKRRFGWEFNGMRLHEYYFGNMSKKSGKLTAESELTNKIKENFGSYENWEKDFRATGSLRGIGWVILYYDKESDKLFNVWIDEHALGHLSGTKPLLVMDVFEHAFMLDYGLKRGDYIEAFFGAIDWSVVEERLEG